MHLLMGFLKLRTNICLEWWGICVGWEIDYEGFELFKGGAKYLDVFLSDIRKSLKCKYMVYFFQKKGESNRNG